MKHKKKPASSRVPAILAVLAAVTFLAMIWKEYPAVVRYIKMERM